MDEKVKLLIAIGARPLSHKQSLQELTEKRFLRH
jgi:hypothetical protein